MIEYLRCGHAAGGAGPSYISEVGSALFARG